MNCNWELVASVPPLAFEPFTHKTRWIKQGKSSITRLIADIERLDDNGKFTISQLTAKDGTWAVLMYDSFLGWRLVTTDVSF